MQLPPFLLEHWFARYEHATPPIRFNLGASTGPRWTLGELLALEDGFAETLDELRMTYASSAGGRALREAIAGHTETDPESVVVTTGASEAVSILFCLAAEPGANVVLPSPAFSSFGAIANAWGLAVKTYDLRRDDGFRFSAARVLDAVDDRTALVLANTPHNPSGTVIPRAEIETLADRLEARGIPLVVDEVYHPVYFGTPAASASGIGNVIIVGDMSKALSLPGLRTGWIVDADAERRARALDARGYFTVSGSPLLEAIAAHALRHRETVLARSRAVAGRNLTALTTLIERHHDVLHWVPPQGGTIAFPWFVDGRDSRGFCTALAADGVLIVPGECFYAPEHVRIGFGAEADGFAEALSIMSRALEAN